MQKNGISAVFREIPSNVLTAEQLGLPAVNSKLADLPRGLVLVTGPTGSGKSTTLAAKIVDRIIEVFPSTEQAQIRSTLSDGLRAVVAQVLFKRIDKKGRCAAMEILIATPAVRNLIREAKTHQIPSMIQTGKQYGMQLLDDAIMQLYKKGWISPDEAYGKANNKGIFRPFLKHPPNDFTEA